MPIDTHDQVLHLRAIKSERCAASDRNTCARSSESATLSISAICLGVVYGGIIERLAAFVIFGVLFILLGFSSIVSRDFTHLNLNGLIQDVWAFIGFSLLAVFGYKVWPIFCASFQLLAIGGHVIRILSLDVRPIVYAWITAMPTWCVLITMLIGIAHHQYLLHRSRLWLEAQKDVGDAVPVEVIDSPLALADNS